MSARSLSLIAWMMAFVPATAHADLTWYVNDYEGFLAAAGNVQVIDFETLPDGSPSYSGAEITPEFNYTGQGVTFSTPVPELFIAGNPVGGFELRADSYPSMELTWITATLEMPALAVGAFSNDLWTMDVYDVTGSLLGSENVVASGLTFLGAISDIPVGSAIVDDHFSAVNAHSFHFVEVPEPATLGVLVIVAAFAVKGSRRT